MATWAALRRFVTRAAISRALRDGQIRRLARDRYGVPQTDAALAAAQAVGGVLSHTDAALHHGWAVKQIAPRPHVTVPRARKITPERRHRVTLHRYDLGPDDCSGFATSRELTLLQCLRSLPFDEALAVADSALRAGEHRLLAHVSREAKGPGSAQVRRVAGLATELAANPFESVLRAIALDVPGLRVRPQVQVLEEPGPAWADLVDTDLGIVLEADSFQWHGGRKELMHDAHRYNRMAVAGWLVLRFSWEDVMQHPALVHDTLVLATQARTKRHGIA